MLTATAAVIRRNWSLIPLIRRKCPEILITFHIPHMAKIIVQNTEITVLSYNDKDYISLTDMANGKQSESRAADIIKNWIRTRYTIEFLGTWEMIHNPNFKVVEFDHFRMQAGLPSFVMSVSEWIEKTNAIGIVVKKGRYGGTYAFKDIAFEFGTAISVTFKLYLIDEFQRLKEEEQKQLGWTAKTLGSSGKKKAGLSARFSLCERVRGLVVELELSEAVVNRVARALNAVILVCAGFLEVECQR